MNDPVYTQSAIQAIVGPEYRVKAARGTGNFQVNLELKGTGLTGHAKCTLIIAAFDKLKAAGYPVQENDLKTDSKGEDGTWKSWLCIYVNKPDANQRSGGGVDAATIAAAVAATLLAMGFKPPTQPVPDHVETPDAPPADPDAEEVTPI